MDVSQECVNVFKIKTSVNTKTMATTDNSKTIITDHLEEDVIQIPSQRFALISVVSPQSNQQYTSCALKIRGVFQTEEEGRRHANKLTQVDRTFDVFLVDMYKWLPIPPDTDHIGDQVYQDKMLNDIIQGHKEQQVLVKQHFEERKMESLTNPLPPVIVEEDPVSEENAVENETKEYL